MPATTLLMMVRSPSSTNKFPPQLAPSGPSARVKASRRPVEGKSCGEALGEALLDGEVEALGDKLGLVLADSLDEEETEGDSDDEGLSDALGLRDALSLLLGEREVDGEGVGLTLGEPTEETERISTMPPTLGEAVLSVNEPELTVVMASNT